MDSKDNIILGILGFLIVICCLFNFSDDFDYSYAPEDGYNVDFNTPTEMNGNKISYAFQSLLNTASDIVNFARKTTDAVFSTFDKSIKTEDPEFNMNYEKLYEKGKAYIDSQGFFKRMMWTPWLTALTDHLNGYYTILGIRVEFLGGPLELNIYKEYCNWTDEEILFLHEFMVENERTHYYNGEKFSYK